MIPYIRDCDKNKWPPSFCFCNKPTPFIPSATYNLPLYHVCCTCSCLCARLLATTSVLFLFVLTYAVCPSAYIPMCLPCILCSHCDTSVQLCPSLYSPFRYSLFTGHHLCFPPKNKYPVTVSVTETVTMRVANDDK
jgi:hypothetical protein